MKPRARRRRSRLVFAGSALAAAAGFAALGHWQVERLAWKEALIAAVAERLAEPPVPAPGPATWDRVDADTDAYRRVRLQGHWLVGHDTYVQATTALGAGWWLLTPLERGDGDRVLVNRGFVARRPARDPATTAVTITGLLRISEPGAGFPRRDDPAADRWFSRDVTAIARTRGLARVAPYFVDAGRDSAAGPDDPVGGLTVVAFRNHHRVYALTWFALAALAGFASVRVLVDRPDGRPDVGPDGGPDTATAVADRIDARPT